MREKALLVLPTKSPFMRVDEEILESAYVLKTIHLGQNISKPYYLMSILRSLLTLIRCRGCSKVMIWFADYHAAPFVLLARVLGIKSYVFIGGYDAVKYPCLGMGVYCSSMREFCARLALRNCTHIIANHQALLSSSNSYYRSSGHPEGIYRLVPGLKTPASVVFNALPDFPQPDFDTERKRQVLTVGTTPRLQDFYNKGYDLLAEVAKRRPELNFVFVGIQDRWRTELNRRHQLKNLPNVTIHEALESGELLKLMALSAVYAQPSISEGMPNALMEAMLMGCVPVGSNVAGIPTVIGKHGFIFRQRDPKLLEDALDLALALEPDRKSISESVRTKFALENRKARLLKILKN